MKKVLFLAVVAILALALLPAGVRHKVVGYRGLTDWSNLYPNGASKCWQDNDISLIAQATDSIIHIVPTTAKDSLFTCTHQDFWVTVPAAVDPNSEVKFILFGRFSRDTLILRAGEGWSGDRVIDSLFVVTDSARVRYSLSGHGEW